MRYTIHIDPDEDGQETLQDHLHATDMAMLLHAIAEEMRLAAKHGGDEAAGKWRDRMYALAAEFGVEIR